jgi:serine/threonine protein kinase
VFQFETGEIAAERLQIVQFLGRGGTGEVYAADDVNSGIRVAVKALSANPSTRQNFDRGLRREFQMARRITHENLCRINALVERRTGRLFILGPGWIPVHLASAHRYSFNAYGYYNDLDYGMTWETCEHATAIMERPHRHQDICVYPAHRLNVAHR